MALAKRVTAPTNPANGQRSNRSFRKAAGRRGTYQGQLAWHQLDHRDDLHRRIPQRQAGATRRLVSHKPANQARGPATADQRALEY